MRLGWHQIDPGPVADGDYALSVVDGVAVELVLLPAPAPVPLTTIGPDGPGIVFAADGHIIYVEEP